MLFFVYTMSRKEERRGLEKETSLEVWVKALWVKTKWVELSISALILGAQASVLKLGKGKTGVDTGIAEPDVLSWWTVKYAEISANFST